MYWVHRAHADRSARVGLLLLFGIPGVMLLVFGVAYAIDGRDGGFIALATGLGMLAPLISPVRRFFASWTPMNADSAIDMSGLCLVLGVIGYLASQYAFSPDPEDVGDAVSVGYLIIQFLFEIGLAYILVGFGLVRTIKTASVRLGLRWPTWRSIGVAVGCVLIAFVISAIGGVLTNVLQPDVADEIERISKEITDPVSSPVGAVLFGLGAGFGEELLLRGAIQPRYGILVTSTLFALLHNQYGISFVLLGIFGIGVLLGLERKYYGTTAAIITHAIFNAIAVLAGN
jgi:membrane protease YdiL (CAAX protease family)